MAIPSDNLLSCRQEERVDALARYSTQGLACGGCHCWGPCVHIHMGRNAINEPQLLTHPLHAMLLATVWERRPVDAQSTT
jgi:hypothetical protein